MPANYYEEEEFASKFDGKIFMRILGLVKPHWKWVAGFLTLILFVSSIDAYFTYLSKRIVDEGIVPGNVKALVSILGQYGALIVIQAAWCLVSSTWSASWANACATTCARPCSTTCSSCRCPTTAARRWAGSCRASPPIPNGSPT